MSGWVIAKYALALTGLAFVLAADRLVPHWLGYIGLVLIVAAFLLRFVQRRYAGANVADPTRP